jgi:MFS family permease
VPSNDHDGTIAETGDGPRGGIPISLAVGLVLAVTLVAFETTAVITALPTITGELNGDSLYGATLSAYLLADLVALVAVAEVIDRRGARLPFIVCITSFVIGLIVAAAAPAMWVVVLGRVLQGAGTGGIAPISYVVVRRAVPESAQPTMYAILSAGWVLPSLIAPGLAGAVTDGAGWRWVFLGIVPLAIVVGSVTAVAMRHVPAPVLAPDAVRPPSRLPTALRLSGGVGLLVTGLQSDRPALLITLSIVGVALALPAFRRLAPAGVLTARMGLPAILACRTLATATFLGVDSFVPLAADRIHGAPPTAQGFVIVGAAITWSIGQAVAARHPHWRPDRSVRMGFVLLTIGIVGVVPVLWSTWPLPATFAAWCIGGFGMGILFNPTSVAAMTYAEDGRDGLVGSQIHLADTLGFGLMGGIGGAAVAVADRTDVTLGSALGLNFALAGGCAALGIMASRGVRRRAPTTR